MNRSTGSAQAVQPDTDSQFVSTNWHVGWDLRNPESGRLDAKQVAQFFGLPLIAMASLLHRDLSTLSKSPDGRPLQESLAVFERIATALLRMTSSPSHAKMWLNAPNPDLERKAPLEVIREGHADVVVELLEDMLVGQPG